ncbi:hypothetical protein D3C87_257950 [compost metagenome]
MKKQLLLIATLAGLSSQAFAHGEDAPGPHGGHIRMPGAFHTELSLDEKTQDLHVYLIDMEFKNPTVKESKLEAVAKRGKSSVKFTCSVMDGNHFHCVPEKKYPLKGEIILNATRENAVGNEAVYKLPLMKFKGGKKSEGHQHH